MIGDFVNVSISGMLRLLAVHRQTGILTLKGDDGEGEIYIREGMIVGTSHGAGKVREEVLRLLVLKKGYFQFAAQENLPLKKEQEKVEDVENLILEASRQVPPQEAAEFLPGDEAVLQISPIAGEREWLRLSFQRDEWNMLTRINGEDSIGLVREKSAMKKGRALQILNGLLAAGIIRKTRFKIPKLMEIASRELGNMGETLVRESMRKLHMDQTRMHMRQLIDLLNELERSITLLLGPTRARTVIDQMWEGSK